MSFNKGPKLKVIELFFPLLGKGKMVISQHFKNVDFTYFYIVLFHSPMFCYTYLYSVLLTYVLFYSDMFCSTQICSVLLRYVLFYSDIFCSAQLCSVKLSQVLFCSTHLRSDLYTYDLFYHKNISLCKVVADIAVAFDTREQAVESSHRQFLYYI